MVKTNEFILTYAEHRIIWVFYMVEMGQHVHGKSKTPFVASVAVVVVFFAFWTGHIISPTVNI